MKIVEPRVYLIAESRIDAPGMIGALKEIGGKTALDWFDTKLDGHGVEGIIGLTEEALRGELLTEVAGRTCYKSFGIGLNPNVTKIREDSKEYLANTLAKGDGSIFEHATCTFAFVNVSRVFTHELVRHRVGVAISQESLRYVRIDEENQMKVWIPDLSKFDKYVVESASLTKNSDYVLETQLSKAESNYNVIQSIYDWDKMSFAEKKELTSALRRMLPQGMLTNMIWTANHRTLRHVLAQRTSEGAEVEIRMVFDRVGTILKERFPLIYQDFERKELPDGTGSWVPKWVKA